MRKLFLIFLIGFRLPIFLGASFLPNEVSGLKSKILSSGFVSELSEISGALYNPAGVLKGEKIAFEISYQSMYNSWFGLKDISIDGVYSYGLGAKFRIDNNDFGILVNSIENNFDEYSDIGEFAKKNSIIKRETDIFFSREILKELDVGISLVFSQFKLIDKKFYSLSSDLGFKYLLRKDCGIGLSFKNLYSTGMKFEEGEENLNLVVIGGLFAEVYRNLNFYIGGREEVGGTLKFSLGGIYKISIFEIMAGYEIGNFNGLKSDLNNGNLRAGLSLRIKKIKLGYGLTISELGESNIISILIYGGDKKWF